MLDFRPCLVLESHLVRDCDGHLVVKLTQSRIICQRGSHEDSSRLGWDVVVLLRDFLSF